MVEDLEKQIVLTLNKYTMRLFEISPKYKKGSRTKEVEINARVLNDLRTNFNHYFERFSFPVIFRGMSSIPANLLKVDPSKFTRLSQNTSNEYTLLVDNLDNWKSFPKRSKSIVCTLSAGIAEDYGPVFAVIPQNGAKIGICPAIDFWDSFHVTYGMPMSDFNYNIKEIANALDIQYDDKSAKSLFSALQKISKNIHTIEKHSFSNRLFNRFLKNNKTKNFFEYVSYVVDPKVNGFSLSTIETINKFNSNEVWTDAPSYLVLHDDDLGYKGLRDLVLNKQKLSK